MKFRQRLNLPFEYDVVFTRDLFAPDNESITQSIGSKPTGSKAAFFIDQGVLKHWPDLPQRITRWCELHPNVWRLVSTPLAVPGGEEVKNDLSFVQKMTHQLQRLELCRHSYIVAVGGGAVLDAVGLAAAVFHRGIRLVRVPTTVLSQNDSGVGVKNGINFDGRKNQIGTFSPPFAVFNDALFLTTLEQRDWVGGLAEAFKVGIVKDVALLEELEKSAAALATRDLEAMERVVQLCAIRHLEHIRDGGDPFEFGSARPLDFGHWSAHKLESMTDHRLRHGEAVAIGIALDLHCAAILGFISDADCHRMCEAMERCGLNLKHPSLTRRHNSTGCLVILDGLEEFRQHLGGQLTLAMPKGLGGKQDIYELAETVVEEGLRRLITRSPAAIKTASFPPLPASSSPKEQKSQP